MSLFPFMKSQGDNVINQVNLSSREYDVNFKDSTMSGKVLEGKEAVKVWIEKALLTNRYIYDIYSWDYGKDLNNIIGKGYEKGFIDSEVERMIKDCLLINPRITSCHSFDIHLNNDELNVTFTVDTIYGEVVINA